MPDLSEKEWHLGLGVQVCYSTAWMIEAERLTSRLGNLSDIVSQDKKTRKAESGGVLREAEAGRSL